MEIHEKTHESAPSVAEVLERLQKYVNVMDGERPLHNIDDAIKLAIRAGVLWRWAHNGPSYQFRWSSEHPVIDIPEPHVCMVLAKRILEVYTPVGDATVVGVMHPGQTEFTLATPAALKLAGELEDVDLTTIEGTGQDGKVTVNDVRAQAEELKKELEELKKSANAISMEEALESLGDPEEELEKQSKVK